MLENVGRGRQTAIVSTPTARCLLPAGLILLVSFHALADSPDPSGLGDWSAFNPKTWTGADPSPGKVIASPTALTREKGTLGFDFSTYVLGPHFTDAAFFSFYDFYYGITENLEIMFQTYVPFGYLGFGLYPKASVKLHDFVTLGWTMDFGFVWAYMLREDIEKVSDQVWMIVGGTPLVITIGNTNHFLNLSVHTLMYRNYPDGCFMTYDDKCYQEGKSVANQLAVLSTLGVSLRVSKRVKISVDLWYIYVRGPKKYYDDMTYNHIIIPMVGLKIFGKDIWGSIGLLSFLGIDAEQGHLMAWPIPMISFGWNTRTGKSRNMQEQGSQSLPPVF